MDLPNNHIGMGALLFALGTITGLLFFAAFGMLAGTVFGILVVILALGLLYDTTREPDKADDDAKEDEEEEEQKQEDLSRLSFLARILYSAIVVISISGSIWAVMLSSVLLLGVKFESKTWLLPLLFALFLEGWSLYNRFIRRPIYKMLEQQRDGKEDS